MQPPLVYIILLNYNNYKDTIECLISLKNITYQNYNIVIIDNNSPNDSIDHFVEYFDNINLKYIYYKSQEDALTDSENNTSITLIQSRYNGGFGFGNNIGIKYALKNYADYVLVLNNDTIVDKYFLEPLVDKCENDNEIGIASSKIYFYDKPDTIWFNGGEFNSRTASVKHFNFNEKDIGQKITSEISFISGCLMLLPRKVLEDVALFNEDYFMYYEDLEFSHRMLNKKYKLIVCDNSILWHKIGHSTGGQFSKFSVYWRTKNMNQFIYKNIEGMFSKALAFSSYNFNTLIKLILNYEVNLVFEHIKAIKDSLIGEYYET